MLSKKILSIVLGLIIFSTQVSAQNESSYKEIKLVAKKMAPQVKDIEHYAWWIYTYSTKYHIDPYLMLALIKVESDFDQKAISKTGDLSLAQINYKVWQKELSRQGVKLNYYKLKTNYAYAINTMGLILQILEKRYAHKDANWFARYHSATKQHKRAYLKKVNNQLRKISSLKEQNSFIARSN